MGTRNGTWLLSALVLLVVRAAACGGSGDDASTRVETTGSVAGVESADEPDTTTTDPQAAEPQATIDVDSNGGEYSVSMVINGDELAADATLKALEREGFNEFVKKGSPDEGFDVYWPGLTMDEAIQGVEDIRLARNLFGAVVSKTPSIP